MTADELKKQFALAMPTEIDGNKRPDAPVPIDNAFFLDIPQLIAKDPVLYSTMNLIFSVLLSNDKLLKDWHDALEKALQDQNFDIVTVAKKGLMSPEMLQKLNGIENGANKYVHPPTHPANMIVPDATHRFVTDAEKDTWNKKAGTAVVTTVANGLAPKLDGNGTHYFAGDGTYKALPTTADTAAGLTTAIAYGDIVGKTIAEFKTLLYTEVKKAPSQGMRLITFSADLGGLVASWNAGTDTAVIKGGTTNSVLISNAYISNAYASLEMWSYWKGARYRIQLSNGVWDKWEKVVETVNSILTADRAMADSDGNTLQQTYAKKTDIPTKLPSPNAVTFTGGATGTYDGSKAVTINIPQGMTVNDTAYISANAPSKPVSIWFKTV